MNERILEAISKLKKAQDELEIKLKEIKHDIDDKGSLNMQKALFTVADDLARYTIKDGNWYYNGKDTGIQAEAHDGEDGKQGPQGIPGKNGKDGKDGKPGKDGKNGKDGRPGRDGKDGKDGKQGLPGRDGKDGIVPDLKIGKIEVSPEYGGAMAKLRPGKDNIIYLDLTLPRGPQGFTGFDGKDAKINGQNTINIEAGNHINISQEGETLTISATGGGGGTSDYEELDNLPQINSIELKGNVSSSTLGVQNIEDNTLQTTNKTVTSAINEVNSIAKGANQAVGYNNYSAMITALNAMDDDEYNVGQNVYIVTVNVPDLWVSSVESTSSTYTYVDDATVVNDLETNGYIQVGYYKLSMLETQKVDLTNYVTNTDYAGSNKAGVIKTTTYYGTGITSAGALLSAIKTYQQYQDTTTTPNMFISKGTLENVITGKGLVSNTDYATSSVGGVIKCFNSDGLNINNGTLITATKTYAQYNSGGNWMFVGKGTLENVITGKGLVSNTDYATSSTGGVVKKGSYDFGVDTNGYAYAYDRTYSVYLNNNKNCFISKGTLENVITGKGLVSNTDYATDTVGGVIKVTNGDHGMTVDEGVLKGTVRTLAQYNNMSSKGIVCKGTLENVITGKELDLKQLSTFDSTKTQVLKNINGTLTWVNE